ncbi:MAG: family 43 glycosylhydrolase, partial [Leadbetterella sp.]|nr:family 43 glycosylhydrolase [Leadbetterella sp.]
FDGQKDHATVEGPKMYKRNGYYYLSAPAGGVATGWQLILRSKNIYGPYEEKVVLRQGDTPVNGPHQGAWVDTPSGEWWFLHFQDKEAYGRIVHLQPMTWKDNWPVMGINGQPVMQHKKPATGKAYAPVTPAESDEFNAPRTGLQWQWAANRETVYGFPSSAGYFRLNTFRADSSGDLYDFPNFFSQKFPAEEFSATTRIEFKLNGKLNTEKLGFIIKGYSYAFAGLTHKNGVHYITYNELAGAGRGEKEKIIREIRQNTVYFRVEVRKGALCDFYYSEDGKNFIKMNETPFQAQKGHWIGARIGYIAARREDTNDSGYMNIDWFRTDTL